MPFVSKTLPYSFCACVQNILEIVMFVIEKMKLVSFNLFLDAPPTQVLRFYTGCHLDQNFSKSIIGFQKVKVLNY